MTTLFEVEWSHHLQRVFSVGGELTVWVIHCIVASAFLSISRTTILICNESNYEATFCHSYWFDDRIWKFGWQRLEQNTVKETVSRKIEEEREHKKVQMSYSMFQSHLMCSGTLVTAQIAERPTNCWSEIWHYIYNITIWWLHGHIWAFVTLSYFQTLSSNHKTIKTEMLSSLQSYAHASRVFTSTLSAVNWLAPVWVPEAIVPIIRSA